MARVSSWQLLSVGLVVGCLPSSSRPCASVWRRSGSNGTQLVIEDNLINHLQPARPQFPANGNRSLHRLWRTENRRLRIARTSILDSLSSIRHLFPSPSNRFPLSFISSSCLEK